MNFKTIVLILIIFIANTKIYSQSKIEFKDTIINRAIINKIPVYGYLENFENGNLEICLEFNALVIDIKEVLVDNNTIFKNISDYNILLNNYNNAKLFVRTDNFFINKEGILFYLKLEGLAGGDTISNLNFQCLLFNDVEVSNKNFINGKIIVNSSIINPKSIEGISQNKPNPFNDETYFNITLDKSTFLDFKIYTLDGRLIKNLTDEGFELSMYDNKGNKIKDYNSNLLEKGEYKLVLKNIHSTVSSGVYYFVMKTNYNVYKINMLLLK